MKPDPETPNWSARFVATVLSLSCVLSAHAQSNGFWQNLAPLPTARQEVATAVLNGKIYVIGGYDADPRSTALVEVYDPSTDTWSSAAPIPSATNHSAAAVAAGKLYSINLSVMHVYNPATNSWTQAATAPSAHARTPAVGVFEGKIYLAGGMATTSSRALEVYDPATNTWTVRASMSVARDHTGGAFIKSRIPGACCPACQTRATGSGLRSLAIACISPVEVTRRALARAM